MGRALGMSGYGTVLHFFVVKLKPNGAKRELDLCLRFKASDTSVDFAGSEPVLSAFCFPLGPESVPPKEFMASEVTVAHLHAFFSCYGVPCTAE